MQRCTALGCLWDVTQLAEVIGGDWPAELLQLYESERLGFVRVAYLLTRRRDVAEELVQDAFLAAVGRWDGVEYPKAYVRAAVVNRCRNWIRHQSVVRRRLRVVGSEEAAAAPEQPDELWDALGRLDERRRAAIVLRFYEDLPDREIAEVLGCRPAT